MHENGIDVANLIAAIVSSCFPDCYYTLLKAVLGLILLRNEYVAQVELRQRKVRFVRSCRRHRENLWFLETVRGRRGGFMLSRT